MTTNDNLIQSTDTLNPTLQAVYQLLATSTNQPTPFPNIPLVVVQPDSFVKTSETTLAS
jgi:hypothetical protein